MKIEIEIPELAEGWEYQARQPRKGEERMLLQANNQWSKPEEELCLPEGTFTLCIFAYRVRDEFAERYEALGLPDGVAWMNETHGVQWSQNTTGSEMGFAIHSFRRMHGGKAFKVEGGK